MDVTVIQSYHDRNTNTLIIGGYRHYSVEVRQKCGCDEGVGQLFKASLRRSSLERERAVGTEGDREMGVFLRDTLLIMSQIVENGIRFLGSRCQHSQMRS